MFKFIKRLFCKHDWEICRKIDAFQCLKGEKLYKRCKKCGKIVEYIYREYEGDGYK